MSVWKSADTPPPDDREVLVAGYAADVTCTAGQSEQRFICRFHESANEWKETHTEQRINVRCWTEIPGTGAGSQHAATGMPIYFHVAPPGLLPGHIIQPGTWGQKMRIYGKGGQTFSDHSSAYDLIWEIVLEATRRALAPTAPSRLDCVFGCCSEADALAFRDKVRPGHQVYQIQVSPEIGTYVADFDAITNLPGGPFVDMFVEQARRYWTSSPVGTCEALIGGSAVIASPNKRRQSRRPKFRAKTRHP
jgi:hypothetical protein